jgi:pimeloyl-ACP methyl ester carboxylesterase
MKRLPLDSTTPIRWLGLAWPLTIVATYACGASFAEPEDAVRAPRTALDQSTPADTATPFRANAVTYRNARGATVRALLFGVAAGGAHPALVFLHDVGSNGAEWVDEARQLATAGVVVLAPEWTLGQGYPSDDAELWRCAVDDVRRSLDVLAARGDVDPGRLGYLGVGFGASVGAIVATLDDRVRALVLIEPEGDPRAGSYSSLRWRWGIERPDALSPSRRLGVTQAHPPLLLQFGSLERNLSDEDIVMWTAAVTERDELRWYATSRGPDAVRDRIAFLLPRLGIGSGSAER